MLDLRVVLTDDSRLLPRQTEPLVYPGSELGHKLLKNGDWSLCSGASPYICLSSCSCLSCTRYRIEGHRADGKFQVGSTYLRNARCQWAKERTFVTCPKLGMPEIPALRSPRQESYEFKDSLGFMKTLSQK